MIEDEQVQLCVYVSAKMKLISLSSLEAVSLKYIDHIFSAYIPYTWFYDGTGWVQDIKTALENTRHVIAMPIGKLVTRKKLARAFSKLRRG